MLTGRRYVTLGMVIVLCALATAGCKRSRKSNSSNTTTTGIFTTDNFPGATVQDGNVADDLRGFSSSADDYIAGTLVCTHNGDRGTIMVTYQVGDQLFASYYNGHWTRGVALRHFDTDPSTIDAAEVIHAFINTSNDGSSEARDRDGDCMIFWNAQDLDSDGGAGPDDPNQVEFMSYFDVTHADDESLNHGFDIDPLDPGFFEANRLSIDDDAGEDVEFQVLVTDGLCGEARWEDGGNVYSYGNDTSAIFVAWRQTTDKGLGTFDEVTDVVGFNLSTVVDEEFPLIGTVDTEVAISTFGSSDSGVTSQDTAVSDEYCSYNFLLQYRVISLVGGGFTNVPTTPALSFALPFPGGDVDITMQSSFFDPTSFTQNNEVLNDYIPNSSITSIDDMNSDWTRETSYGGFLTATGSVTYGRDEGLSCFVTFFTEEVDSDNTDGVGYNSDDLAGTSNECHVKIAEVDEATGNYLNTLENPQVDLEDGTIFEGMYTGFAMESAISRNGDYVWVTYIKQNSSGAFDDYNPEVAEYLTTRVDSDGNPVPVAALTSSLGFPFSVDPVDQGPGGFVFWDMFQSNLGYICGQQSDPFEMHFFFGQNVLSTADDRIYTMTLTADVDGVVGGETVTGLSVLVDEDNLGFFDNFGSVGNYAHDHGAFNATDAGQDGDIFYAFLFDDDATDGVSDVFLAAGRFGLTAAAPIRMDSGVFYRQDDYNPNFGGQELVMISTPPGRDISTFDPTAPGYGTGADHGPSNIHLVFREAETDSTPISTGGNTLTGYALRTRQYTTNNAPGVFGDDFIPNAGTTFAKPFDLDLPFIDPNTGDEADPRSFQVCDDTVTIEFVEAGHLYYQEFSGNSNGSVGWRTSSDNVSDPALIDDDGGELITGEVDICSRSCTCCDVDGTAIFWVKDLNVSGSDVDRLQVRIIDRGNR